MVEHQVRNILNRMQTDTCCLNFSQGLMYAQLPAQSGLQVLNAPAIRPSANRISHLSFLIRAPELLFFELLW